MYCPSSFIISYRHPCAVLQLGHPRVHPFLGLATILVPLSVLPGPQCYLAFPLVNSSSHRFSFLTLPSITSMSFQTLLFTLFCPSFPDFPMVFQPQVHPPHFILDQCDFFFPPIHHCLGPQPVDPVNLKCLVK